MKSFPLMNSKGMPSGSMPLEIIALHENQAMKNHGGQTLRELAKRGGLSFEEALAVLEDRPFCKDSLADIKLNKIVKEFYNIK